jgi:type VI secretion system protein ImpL
MGIFILALLLIAAAWIGGYFLGLALWIKIAITAFAVLLVVGVLLYRRWRAKRAARALEEELIKQAEEQVANARPDRRAEIFELQQQFKKGLAALKSSKLGSSGGGALYALPWYMIVGPPGAGKTTALRHSGLQFPFQDAGGNAQLKGVGGTKNCDWWFTNEAILLDTAGRFATHEEDREEWTAFLDMLKKYRAKKPVNGVLVAVSVADVIGGTEEQLETLGKALRARIDEVMTRLAMIVPVYVVFTKIDLVAGFIETFEDLKKSERGQVWGATFPLAGPQADAPEKSFENEFDLLVESLHAHAVKRVANVRRVEKRARVLQFPVEMRALKTSLSELVGVLLRKNTFQETPLFRGVYFTSGTQEGRPLDRVIGAMARAFGLRQSPDSETTASGKPAADAKSYFLTELFSKVIFPDQFVAGRTRAESRRQLVTRVGYAAGALLLASIIVAPASVSYSKNRALVQETQEIARGASTIDWGDGNALGDKLEKLEPLRARVELLEQWNKDGAPFSYRWGMYTGETLRRPLQAEYAALVQRALSSPVKTSLENRLRSIETASNRSPDDFNRIYDDLKKYLMLTETEHLDVDWASPRVAHLWGELLAEKSKDEEALLVLNTEQYLSLVKQGALAPLPRDEKLVSYARSELLRVPQVGRLYETLVRDTNTEIAPIKRETLFYGSIAPFVTSRRNVKVDGAYTKLGWQKIRKLLDVERSKLTSEGWVLGREDKLSEADVQKQVQALRQVYFERFRDAWRDFIADLDIVQPKNAEGSLDELLALSEPEWPYLRLLRTLDENTSLELTDAEAGKESSLLNTAADLAKQKLLGQPIDAGALIPGMGGRPISIVEQSYKPLTTFAVPPPAAAGAPPGPPTGLSQYQGILRKLIGVLTDMKDAKAPPDPKALTTEFETAYRSTTALLADQDAFTRPLLAPLLTNPVAFAWAGVLKDAGGAAGGLWEVGAWKTWSTKIEPAYPFADAAPLDVKVEDFADFFRPLTGQLWAFYEQTLKGSLEKQGGDFVPTRRFKSQIAYSNAFLDCLRRSQKITDATFGADPKMPQVQFEVNLHSVSPDVSEVAIEIDGVAHTYTNTPEEWTRIEWPAKEAKARGAKVRVRGINNQSEEIVRAGDFGFFRLLDAADVKPGYAAGKVGNEAVLVATWKLRSQEGSQVKIDIRPTKSEAPFAKGFFAGLKCPRIITQGEP